MREYINIHLQVLLFDPGSGVPVGGKKRERGYLISEAYSKQKDSSDLGEEKGKEKKILQNL